MRALLFVCLVACSAPAVMSELDRAESLEKRGDNRAALAAYGEAIDRCRREPPRHLRRSDCVDAYLHRAELLVTMQRRREAADAYQAIPAALPGQRTAAAEALYRAGKLRLELGQDRAAYTLLWKVVTDFPDQDFAGDALGDVVSDGRRRNPTQLAAVLSRLATALARTEVGDNVLYFLGDLSERELERPRQALAFYDKLFRDYPKSGLFDEALWRGARLARRLGDPRGAVRRLRQLLATREVSLGGGSYFSVWLDNAQLELGVVLRDDLGDLDAAAAAFEKLPEDYPASILRDDALFELAVTRARGGERGAACRALAALARDWPDSKYQLEKAPALAKKLGCGDHTQK